MKRFAMLWVLVSAGCSPKQASLPSFDHGTQGGFTVFRAERTVELWRYLSSCGPDSTTSGLRPSWNPEERHVERARRGVRLAFEQVDWGTAARRAAGEYFFWIFGAYDGGLPGVLVVGARAEAFDSLRVVDWPRDSIGEVAFPNWRLEPAIPCPGGLDIFRVFVDTSGTVLRPLRFDGRG